MKCYFALTEPDENNLVYVDLLEVSLKSARLNTTLDLYALYDGPINGRCYELLKQFNVNIIPHKFTHEAYLEKTYPKHFLEKNYGKFIPYKKIAGTFMRMDIPNIETEDEYVLYCDIDVYFCNDITIDTLPKPKYLAAAPEFTKNIEEMDGFNAGILLLNVKNMRLVVQQIFDCLKRGERNKAGLFDQGFLNQFCFESMAHLPIEYNWKPYWGYNSNAKIIHFHGMKPNGSLQNSGFTMNDYVHYMTLKSQPSDFNGLVYYTMLFFDTLGRDGKMWISNYLTNVFLSNLHYTLLELPTNQSHPTNHERIVTYKQFKTDCKLFFSRKWQEFWSKKL